MTAEVTVANRQAVALAADSAITVTSQHGRKAWLSATKIVGLHDPHTVGIMVYGSTNLHRLPWDTLLKQFRGSLPPTPYARLEEYTTALLRFLRSTRVIYPPEEQRIYVIAKLVMEYLDLRRDLGERVESEIAAASSGSLSPAEQRRIISEVIEDWQQMLLRADRLQRLPRDYRSRFAATYRGELREAKALVFQQLPLTSGQSRKLTTLAHLMFERDWPIDSHTGIVVVGYGDDDLFPKMQRVRIDGFALNYLICARDRVQAISRNNTGAVWAFAQGDDVHAFMEGILPAYEQQIEGVLHHKIVELPQELLDRIPGTLKEKAKMKADASQFCHQIFEGTLQELEEYRRDHFVAPVLSVVAALPIDDLAVMAETLVNLTSFRQKVSMSVETVGGPVDVAVISKGDGFIWIKRKNYFQLDQNPRVLAQYFK